MRNIVLCIAALCVGAFVLIANNGSVIAQDALPLPPTAPQVVTIPPPLEGIPPPVGNVPQDLAMQHLSISTATGNVHDFNVEVAKTQMQQATGMMYRHHIPKDTAMLFIFNEEKERYFWMKNTWIPLDMLFIRRDGIITHVHSMAVPNSLTPISSNGPAFAVLELAGGVSDALNINIGDRVVFEDFE